MSLTVVPFYNDNRFLNLWMVDKPFTLDRLSDLPLFVGRDSFQTVCDDKPCYDHIMLSPESRTFFGFEWGGWYFTSNSIPLDGSSQLLFTITQDFSRLKIPWL